MPLATASPGPRCENAVVAGSEDETPARRAEQILALVRAIPEGFVRTYGDLSPGAPRLAGRVLRECEDPALPWWRVVRADGSLSQGERQRQLLLAEDVSWRGDRVDLSDARLPMPPGEG